MVNPDIIFKFQFYGYFETKYPFKDLGRDGWQLLRKDVKTYCRI